MAAGNRKKGLELLELLEVTIEVVNIIDSLNGLVKFCIAPFLQQFFHEHVA